MRPISLVAVAVVICVSSALSQSAWYERISLRGYTQLRFVERHALDVPTAWSSGGFSIRRGRLILSGFVSNDVFLYIQPDFAASNGAVLNVLQLRDAYFDIFLDSLHTYRVRVGQSKVPFGYENLQSSSNRLPIERAEVLNSASVPGERDLGVFVMWAPQSARAVYARLTRDGMKGSGDYGCISVGIYNGQGINRPKLNHTPSWSARMTYPFVFGEMVIEPGFQVLTGRYSPQTSATVQAESNALRDDRYAATLALSPAPLGLLAEYCWGTAPRYVPPTNGGGGYVRTGKIEGGFVTLYGMTKLLGYRVEPFVRWQTFHGGLKSQTDAPMTDLIQWEGGIEWHLTNTLELTLEYIHSNRRSLTPIGSQQSRSEEVWLQMQVNY